MLYGSPEQLIIQRASSRAKTDLTKADLKQALEEHGYEVNDKVTKLDLVLQYAETFGYDKMQEVAHTGVSSKEYQEQFEICHEDVKRMERKGFINVTGYYETQMYGRRQKVPLYDAFQFFGLTKPEVDAWLTENNPKRKAKANE